MQAQDTGLAHAAWPQRSCFRWGLFLSIRRSAIQHEALLFQIPASLSRWGEGTSRALSMPSSRRAPEPCGSPSPFLRLGFDVFGELLRESLSDEPGSSGNRL